MSWEGRGMIESDIDADEMRRGPSSAMTKDAVLSTEALRREMLEWDGNARRIVAETMAITMRDEGQIAGFEHPWIDPWPLQDRAS
jgi:hypothetical protein